MTDKNRIECFFLSQEDLLQAGCLDMRLAMSAAENAMLAFRRDEILFPEKVVQIFNDSTQERINCLPATLLPEKVCGGQMGICISQQSREVRYAESLCCHHTIRD